MAIIGGWGGMVFKVSDKEINTFKGLKWNSGAKFTEHQIHLKEPLLEFTGPESETITFTMIFSAYLGVNPIKEIDKLLLATRKGEAHRLVIGSKTYGKSKWVIVKLSTNLEKYDGSGNLVHASVSVNMKSYQSRPIYNIPSKPKVSIVPKKVKVLEEPKKKEKPKKSIKELAKEVMQGKWGNGAERRDSLTQAGYSYDEVQAEVNRMNARPVQNWQTTSVPINGRTTSHISKKNGGVGMHHNTMMNY